MLMDSLKDAPELAAYTALNSIDFYPVPHYTNFPFVKTGEKIIAQYQHLLLKPITNK